MDWWNHPQDGSASSCAQRHHIGRRSERRLDPFLWAGRQEYSHTSSWWLNQLGHLASRGLSGWSGRRDRRNRKPWWLSSLSRSLGWYSCSCCNQDSLWHWCDCPKSHIQKRSGSIEFHPLWSLCGWWLTSHPRASSLGCLCCHHNNMRFRLICFLPGQAHGLRQAEIPNSVWMNCLGSRHNPFDDRLSTSCRLRIAPVRESNCHTLFHRYKVFWWRYMFRHCYRYDFPRYRCKQNCDSSQGKANKVHMPAAWRSAGIQECRYIGQWINVMNLVWSRSNWGGPWGDRSDEIVWSSLFHPDPFPWHACDRGTLNIFHCMHGRCDRLVRHSSHKGCRSCWSSLCRSHLQYPRRWVYSCRKIDNACPPHCHKTPAC